MAHLVDRFAIRRVNSPGGAAQEMGVAPSECLCDRLGEFSRRFSLAFWRQVMVRDAFVADRLRAQDDVADPPLGLQSSGQAEAEETLHAQGDELLDNDAHNWPTDTEVA